jgi:hypothetical protein
MYNHPISVQNAVNHHHNELLREARDSRLAREAGSTSGSHRTAVIVASLVVLLGLMTFPVF